MEDVLSRLVQHSVNYAIRSGIALTTGYAINAGSRLLKTVKGTEKDEIADLQARLRSKINIISPSIDMIELIAARGNTTLDSALTLTKQLRVDIQALGVRFNLAVSDEEKVQRKSASAKSTEQLSLELKQIISQMKRLLAQIEDAVPLLMLAITTSGVNLSTALPTSVSPSRLLQASTFLSATDAKYAALPGRAVQVGPEFVLSVYMLFAAHAHRTVQEESITDTTWKEVVRKARVRIIRTPISNLYAFPSANDFLRASPRPDSSFPAQDHAHEFAYQITIIEDLDDDRYHEGQSTPFEGVMHAGLREIIPIHEVSKIFYADTGKILKIGSEGEPNNPVLLIKRDGSAEPPRRMMQDDSIENTQRETEDTTGKLRGVQTDTTSPMGFSHDLDQEWIALEVYTEAPESDDDEEGDGEISDDIRSSPPIASRTRSTDFLTAALGGLRVRNSPAPASLADEAVDPSARDDIHTSQLTQSTHSESPANASFGYDSDLPALRSSLSLLELLIRLTALQQFQQSSHLSINDEFLNFFLSGSASTGAGADSEYRKQVRRDARNRVGFDPYDESPIKRRGEDYIQNNGYDEHNATETWQEWQHGANGSLHMSPGLESQHDRTPSPSVRRHTQQRLGISGGRTRSQQLRQDFESHVRSPLGRSDSDSTLGTSPRSPAFDDERK